MIPLLLSIVALHIPVTDARPLARLASASFEWTGGTVARHLRALEQRSAETPAPPGTLLRISSNRPEMESPPTGDRSEQTPSDSRSAATGAETSTSSSDSARLQPAVGPDEPGSEVDQPSREKIVAAHFMLRMGHARHNARPARDYAAHLDQLSEMGVNVVVWFWPDDLYKFESEFDAALSVSNREGRPGFAWGIYGCNDKRILGIIAARETHPGMFKTSDGDILIGGFYNAWKSGGGSCGFDYLAELDRLQVSFAYWPDYWSGEGIDYPDLVQKALGPHRGGWAPFFPGNLRAPRPGIGGVFGVPQWLEWANDSLQQARRKNIGLIVPLLAAYHGNQDHGTESNWMMFEGNGFTGMKRMLEWCLANPIDGIQLVTANDFVEQTNWLDFAGRGPVNSVNHTHNTILAQAGMRAFVAPYLEAFRRRTAPVFSEQFLLAYKLHPGNADSFKDLPAKTQSELVARWIHPKAQAWGSSKSDPHAYARSKYKRIRSHDVFTDYAELCVRLESPARVVFSLGSSRVEVDCPAGETILRIDGDEAADGARRFSATQRGLPSVEVHREGRVAVARAEVPVGDHIVPGNYRALSVVLSPR